MDTSSLGFDSAGVSTELGQAHVAVAWLKGGKGHLVLLEPSGTDLRQRWCGAFEGAPSAIVLDRDGRILVAGTNQGVLHGWSAETGSAAPAVASHAKRISSLSFSADGALLASADEGGKVVLWDARLHRPLEPALVGHAGALGAIALSPDGMLLASGGEDRRLLLWDVRTRRLIGDLFSSPPYSGTSIRALAFSPDGRHLGVALSSGLLLWDVDPQSWQRRLCHLANRELLPQEKSALAEFGDRDWPTCASFEKPDASP